MQPVMVTDAGLSSHPIVVNVTDPSEINAVFDSISYSKVRLVKNVVTNGSESLSLCLCSSVLHQTQMGNIQKTMTLSTKKQFSSYHLLCYCYAIARSKKIAVE